MGDCDGTQFPQPSHSEGQNTFRCHPQSRFGNRKCSDFDFKKSRSHPSVNRSKFLIPYRSETCMQFQRGKCFYGENCHFLHIVTDVRKPGCNPVDVRMKECHWFSSGADCPYGERCQFLHKCDYKTRVDSVTKDVNGGIDRNENYQVEWRMNGGENGHRMVSGKSKLCSKWERFGCCPYGAKCIYAHGKTELKNLRSPTVVNYGYTSRSQAAGEPDSREIDATTMKNLQLKRKRCYVNWDVEKICRIYGDWMDDKQGIHGF